MQTEKWGRSPKFHLRADAIAPVIRQWPQGTFLEVGAGTGEMTQRFLQAGHRGILYDLGDDTRAALRVRFADNPCVTVVDSLDDIADASVDYLIAFEVLEHIVDDRGALASWTRKLKPDGRLLATVPAHQRKFGPGDHRVGHVRRYERAQLRELAQSCGFDRVNIQCYGFPLGNIGRIVGDWLEGGTAPSTSDSVERSIDSGTQQSATVVRLSRFMRPWMLWPFFVLQRATFGADVGDGYVLHAQWRG
ncbi:class I SAM-dependent methyltransferase [Tahibacter amnicola]|uniref:Class I SAM-dependent methyltransferase n=1 Tax=Tahibacter amnicola TaxID=2976241 RepID=A0ABY6BCD1_9GAMM|nr:class I SAM-dependent methyltransferase [Tahibacter amnicola]UXI67699.1 class I SAM-dependent methyltransferase [Tahibacter amnicola]